MLTKSDRSVQISYRTGSKVAHKKLLKSVFCVVVLLPLLSACVGAYRYDMPELPSPVEAPELYQYQPDENYLIQVSDKLNLLSYYDQQLNQSVIVRPDGRISLILIGEIEAANKTPGELSEEIKLAYAEILSGPDINVEVDEMAVRRMYIGGEVKSPSVHNITQSLTLMQVLTLSGGFKDTANFNQVLLLRNSGDEMVVHQIDTDKILTNQNPDVFLTQNDVVYVPRTTIADRGIWMDQYVNNMIPDFLQFNINYQLGTIKTEGDVSQDTTIVTP